MRRTKGFTLVELLVVIAIIALLMGILMPALARVRAIAFRMTCGTNLAGIGKAILIYANDYDEEFPVGGWSNSVFNHGLTPATAWESTSRAGAFGGPPPTASRVTITACFYALVKFADVPTKSFVCKSDSGVAEFDPHKYGTLAEDFQVTDAWEFGPWTSATATDGNPDWRCSYSYHYPFNSQYTLTTGSDPGQPVAADPNPWFIHASAQPKSERFSPGVIGQLGDQDGPYGSKAPFDPVHYTDSDHIKFGNAICHQEEGQNVLFVDGHVAFEKNSFCGIDEDNIYTTYDGYEYRVGNPLKNGTTGLCEPAFKKDSFLVGNRAAVAGP
jgi:prepilin-type N-terminal cleavage/methylation domain-containing protein/prepilin-type processing-associated H-X9-DG protein